MWLAAAPAVAQIVNVPNDDKVMEAAIKKARDTLPAFWSQVGNKQANESGHSVKLAYPKKGGNHEHIWAEVQSKSGDQVTATISNVPRDVTGIKKDQRVTVPVSMVSDWLYWRDGRLHGAYTLRAVLGRMSKADADNWRAKLAPE
jgi:uncharacterized protein YegJ (DUF2314 family)